MAELLGRHRKIFLNCDLPHTSAAPSLTFCGAWADGPSMQEYWITSVSRRFIAKLEKLTLLRQSNQQASVWRKEIIYAEYDLWGRSPGEKT